MKPIADCHLYTFVDKNYLDGRPAGEVARMLCDGGSDIIQLRAKGATPDEVARLAEEVLTVTARQGVPLVINDHPEIARSVGAKFCHLGQEDFFDAGFTHVAQLPNAGPQLQIGLSSHAPAQATRAIQAGADYIAIGPIFATPTKPGRPPVTLDYVRWAHQHVQLPWFAIGGITLDNLDEVLQAGASRICVVSAILRAPNPARACQQFRERLASAHLKA